MYATACVYRELYGKITDRKKSYVNNYLIWNKVFLPQMCGELVSCAEFRAILTPFSEVIRKPLLLLLKEWKGRPLQHRWQDVTPQIAFSSKGKVPNLNKNNSSIKPNKFHSKYVCFGGRKTREERRLTATAARKMVSFSTLIGPFEFERALTTLHSTGGKRTFGRESRAPLGLPTFYASFALSVF